MSLRRSIELAVLAHVVPITAFGAVLSAFLIANYRGQYDTELTLEAMQHHVRWASVALAAFLAASVTSLWRLVWLIRHKPAPN